MGIRPAVETDLRGMLAVRANNSISNDPDPSPGYQATMAGETVLVADDCGIIVGFGVLRAFIRSGGIGNIDELYVLANLHDQGTGSDILKRMEEIAISRGFEWLKVYAHSPNPKDLPKLVRFYEHRGYERIQSDGMTAGVDMMKCIISQNRKHPTS